MEVYILDSLLRRETVVDVFESLVWTERFNEYGDFELVVRSTPANRALFKPGKMLAHNGSYRVMTLESVEDNTDSEGKAMLTLKGRSLEGTVLEKRIVKKTMSDLTAEPVWRMNTTPKTVMTWMFDRICRELMLSPNDGIPFLQTGSIFLADTIPAPVDPIVWEQEPDTLYNALKTVGQLYDLGFRLVRNFDTSKLYFDIYTGSDRTTSQTALPPVVFAPGLDNLQNTTELTNIDAAANVAYVFSSQGYTTVYAQDVDGSISGFDRKVILVKANDVDTSAGTPTADAILSSLIQQGREALSQAKAYSAFDGEISQNSEYKYGVHYNLGDLVEMRNTDGVANKMRVTEQIFVSDNEGERSYPTLTVYTFVSTGSWLSWMGNKTWADLDADTTSVWSNQP